MRSVLIVTQKFDPHVDRVIPVLNERGIPFFRLNTDDFHEDITASAGLDPVAIALADRWGRQHLFPSETRAVWFRKPVHPAAPKAIDDPAARKVALEETLEFLDYPCAIEGVRWINNPLDNERARRKFPQLALAESLGLRVPRSLITNDPERARLFAESLEGSLACKSMRSHGFSADEAQYFIFSRRVRPEEIAQRIEAVRHCPTFLQEYIEKDHELRVTIFGDAVFCCRIESQAVSGAESDWRRVDPFKVPHRIVDLDPSVERALKAMMQRHHLSYGAFDLIVTPRGETVFLELNPNGQWLWIELITGAKMAQAMADLL